MKSRKDGIDPRSYNQALIDVDCMVCDAFDYPVIWRIYRRFSKMVSKMMIRDDKGRMI
jgi:hypothetical protein